MSEIQGIAGRNIKFYRGDVDTGTLIVARTKTMTINNESIDVTSDGDEGYRTLLADPATRSIDMSVEGVIRQTDFLDSLLDPTQTAVLEDYTIVIPGIGEVTGDFRFSSVEVGAPHDDAATFSATVESSGAWTFDGE